MKADKQFPLIPGSEVSLKCSTGYTLTGDTTVTFFFFFFFFFKERLGLERPTGG